jgi:hypothetical protein
VDALHTFNVLSLEALATQVLDAFLAHHDAEVAALCDL